VTAVPTTPAPFPARVPAFGARTERELAIVTNDETASRLAPEWDALAVARGRPLASPYWLLAWRRHLAPPGALLRVVAARADGRLVGVIPLIAVRRHGLWRYETLGGTEMALRGAVLADAGWVDVLAPALEAALARRGPAPAELRLGRMERADPVASALARRRHARWGPPRAAPVLATHPDGFESWMAGKSGNFRQQVRRARRRLERGGAVLRRAGTADEVGEALDAFDRLHGLRFGDRSPLARAETAAAMREAASALAPSGRFFAWTIADRHDATVAVQLFVRAGDTMLFWNGGWDEGWAPAKPGFTTLVAAVEDAHARGVRLIDLGEGDQHYKRRLADGDRPVAELVLRPRTWRGGLSAGDAATRALVRRARRAARPPRAG
jgi:CelD/BcsL family acetyltransferase involved in cellulose biosynthesis